MFFKRFIQTLFPEPRRGVSWFSALALLVYVPLFGLTCWYLDATDRLLFTQPIAFWLLLLTPWFWWMHAAGYSGLTGWRGHAALFIRLCLVGLFIIVLADPRSIRKSDSVQLVLVEDLSASVGSSESQRGVEFLTRLYAQKPERDEIGLVLFGRDSVVEFPPATGIGETAGSIFTLQVERDGTDLESALSLAAAILSEEKTGRIILHTDAVQTQGSYARVLDQLKSRGIPVDVLPVLYEHDHEVRVEKLELPRNVKAMETYEVAVIVASEQDGRGDLVLLENGQRITDPIPVEYHAGKNRYTIPIYLNQPGYYEYEAQIIPQNGPDGKPLDGFVQNNKAISFLNLEGEGKVLLVTDQGADPRDWEELTRTLREADRLVEIKPAHQAPVDPLALLPYEAVVFVNVPREKFTLPQLVALKDAVINQGTGFLMVGGENSFGPGGWRNSPVEEILPVSMDLSQKKVLPKGALAIILHTCEFADGNTYAKDITKQAIKVLGDEDEVGVLLFDWPGGAKWLFDLTPAREFARLFQLINGANPGDMPDFGATMQLGLTSLKNSDAAVKHMIIISDGDPQPAPVPLVQQFRDEKITIATIAIFPHGNDTRVMQEMAKATGGNFYFPNDPKLLPEIFIKEAKTIKKSMILNKDFIPAVAQGDIPSDVLKGIEAMPQLHGLVLTTRKPGANPILLAPKAEGEEDDEEPVLAQWQIGLGRTAAFTSDMSPNWGRDWLQWHQFNAFTKQLIIDIARKVAESDLRMQAFAEAGEGVIVVEDFAPESSFLDIAAKVAGPRNSEVTVKLEQTGPRRFEGRLPLSGEGRYQVAAGVANPGNPRQDRVHGGFVVPYAQEYLRFRSNPIAIAEITEKTGGTVLTGKEDAREMFDKNRRVSKSDKPVPDWFLFALACLVPLDVGFRRVQIDLHLVRSWLGLTRTHKPSDETFSQLLRTKRSVSTRLSQTRGELPPQGEDLVEQRRRAMEKEAAGQQPVVAKPQAAAEPTESTTARLLARRKTIQHEGDDKDQST